MNIYLVRHGESQTNVEKRFAGQLDTCLTKKGEKQAKLLLSYFKDKKIDIIYSSSLSRAVNTIKPTADFFELDVIKDDRLNEINAGDWQGKTYSEILETSYQFRVVWKTDMANCVCDNGESVKDCAKRAFEAFKDIAKNSNAKNVIITSHGLAIRTILSNILYGDIYGLDKLSFLVNAGISHITYENGIFKVKNILITEHLGELITKVPSIV